MMTSPVKHVTAALLGLALGASAAAAGPLADRLAADKPIRLGFAAEEPFAYPGPDGEPLGFANAIALGVLERMGHTATEPVLTDWGGMIPGLIAGRVDIVTGGMYILAARCANVDFSEPIGRFGDALIVPRGNPKDLHNYQDIKNADAIMVTGAGYNTIDAARQEGVPQANIMQVPTTTEILAAVKSGRADAGVLPSLEAHRLESHASDEIEATDSGDMPEWTFNWIGLAFHPDDDEFREKFNAELKNYIGTDEMMEAVRPFQYAEDNLPGDAETEWACANR